jgi:WD40 repeat protein
MDLVRCFVSRVRNCLAATMAAGHLLASHMILVALACACWLVATLFVCSANVPAAKSANRRQISNRFVSHLALDQEGQRLWVCRQKEGITQFNLQTGKVEASIPLPETEWIDSIAHSRDGSTTIVCSKSSSQVCATLYRQGTLVRRTFLDADCVLEIASASHDGTVSVCATDDGSVLCWVYSEGEVHEFSYKLPLDSTIVGMALNPAGRRMAVTQQNGRVSFHDPVTAQVEKNDLQLDCLCLLLDWTDDERLMGVVDVGGRIRVYDATNGRKVFEHNSRGGRDDEVGASSCLQVSRDGNWLAVAGTGVWGINLWNLKSGQLAGRLSKENGMVRTLQFSPGSDRLYTGGMDGKIREWSLESCLQLRIID